MRRKLISFDAFDKIEKGSLANAVNELIEAQDVLAGILELGSLNLHCYDESNVYYETDEGTFIHATYDFDGKHVKFNNIEEVAIDTESEDKARRAVVQSMMEAVLADDETRAKHLFRSYAEGFIPKLRFGKGRKGKDEVAKRVSNDKSNLTKNESTDIDVAQKNDTPSWKKKEAAKKGHAKNPGARFEAQRNKKKTKAKWESLHKTGKWKALKGKVEDAKKAGGGRARGAFIRQTKQENMKEWVNVADNALQYIDYLTSRTTNENVHVRHDDVQNVVAAAVPSSKLRLEGKLQSLKYDTLKTDVKVLREKAMRLYLDESFQQLVSQIKRLNNLADDSELSEKMNALVGTYPNVLYLTHEELSRAVSEALSIVGATNFDDQVCGFIAEGILRTAFESYPERVGRLSSLAGAKVAAEGEDAYTIFQTAVQEFFPKVDEQMAVERRVFEDLHEAFTSIRQAALDSGYDSVRSHATDYLARIEDVLEGKTRPDLSLAEEAAAYINIFVETNLATKPWEIDKTPYRTTVGEHPHMQKIANWPYSPRADLAVDAWGKLPVSDGKNFLKGDGGEENMRNKSWGNVGGNDTYPSLNNPYVPKAGDWTMKTEPGVDKTSDSASGQWSSGDTWPSLTNPYIPSAVKKHVNSDNRVDDVESRVGMKQASDLNQKIS